MPHRFSQNPFWGAPRKFNQELRERKISWLELFYDLVYVIAISKITHHFSVHPNVAGFLDYVYMFAIIYWGWLNGSLYHDMYGSSGLRSRFITLWQMLIVVALIICISGPPNTIIYRGTIALLIMQGYITYIWFSITFYDKTHRRANRPYTICYLLAFGLECYALHLWNSHANMVTIRITFFTALLINFLPAFISARQFKKNNEGLSLTSSMAERLGGLTIIVFGEVVLGVVNSIDAMGVLDFQIWVDISLSLCIVFALWWVFFDLIAGRHAKKGFRNATLIELAYIPTLMTLGMIAVGFHDLFHAFHEENGQHSRMVQEQFGFRIAIFLIGVVIITLFLQTNHENKMPIYRVQLVMILAALAIAAISVLVAFTHLTTYFLMVFLVLVIIILFIINNWRIYGEIQSEKIEPT